MKKWSARPKDACYQRDARMVNVQCSMVNVQWSMVNVQWSMVLTFLLLLTSCDYKELCYDHNHWTNLELTFDWSQAEDADPKGMTVQFYDTEAKTTEPVRYDLKGRYGGQVKLLPGTWNAVAYNYDTEAIRYRGMESIATIEAYTRESTIEEGTQIQTRVTMPRPEGAADEPIILEPDMLYGATGDAFTLDFNSPERIVTLQSCERVCDVVITINNVPNLNYTSQFGGALSGLSTSVFMQSGQLGEGRVTEAFTIDKIDETTLQMEFRIFGHCPHQDEGILNNHLLTIYAILADGSKWYYTIDITEQMHNNSQGTDQYHLDLELDGLPIPKPIVNGSGFQPSIDGWQTVEIDVKM